MYSYIKASLSITVIPVYSIAFNNAWTLMKGPIYSFYSHQVPGSIFLYKLDKSWVICSESGSY